MLNEGGDEGIFMTVLGSTERLKLDDSSLLLVDRESMDFKLLKVPSGAGSLGEDIVRTCRSFRGTVISVPC